MSKRNPVFIIEIRKRIGRDRNESIGKTFGAFSSKQKAIEYVRKNKSDMIRDYTKGYVRSKLFFAILKLEVDGLIWDGPIAEIALDLEGRETYWFRNSK